MKRILKIITSLYAFLMKHVYLIPIIQIIATFVVSFFDLNEYQWNVLGNSVGYSILTGIVYVFIFWNPFFKFCIFTKFSAVGLLLMAVYNLLGITIGYDIYTAWFDRIVFAVVLILTFLLPKKNDR